MPPEQEANLNSSEHLKRLIDVCGALLAVLVFAPLFIFLPIFIKMDSRGPIIYRRKVVGKNGVQFDAYKFRTMVVDAEKILQANPDLNAKFSATFKLKNDPRITPVGSFLRKYSLDELPQLVNVLRGEMSLVGPRMMTDAEIDRYGEYKDMVLSVKPGMTGLWQISGRQKLSFERRMELDCSYVTNWSLTTDIIILFKTFAVVMKTDGAY